MARVIQVDKVVDAQGGDLRVWWVRYPLSATTFALVESCEEAVQTLQQLAKDDLDDPSVESNAGGLEVYEDENWFEWLDDDGNDIDYYLEED